MTLYLHGICCDIEWKPGPRQMPSRYLRAAWNCSIALPRRTATRSSPTTCASDKTAATASYN